MSRLKGPYPCKNFQKMFPKNSRRPLTLDHKIRLKKQLDKAYKSAGIEKSAEVREKRVHQNFKPRPEDKIIKKRQSEEDARDRIREVTIDPLYLVHNFIFIYNNPTYTHHYCNPSYRKRIKCSRNARRNETKVPKSAVNRTKS